MEHQIEYGPSFAWLKINLKAGEDVQAEAGAMVRRSTALQMDTRLNAGRKAGFFRKLKAFFVAIFRKLLGGETMFINTFHGANGGEVVLAPSLSGHIAHHVLDGQKTLFVQAGSYLASTGDIDTKLRFGGLRAMFGGEGLVLLQCTGTGDVFVNSYGGIIEIPVDGKYVVDTGHIVAFDGTLNFKIRGVGGGLKGLFFSGEGLVCEFSGKGNVYIQSRNIRSLVGWISPMLRG